MSKRDYSSEYYAKVSAYQAKKRAERKAQENHSNFTVLSVVGFALGVAIFYQTQHVVLGIVSITAIGALLGAGVDYYLVHSGQKQKKRLS